MNYFTQLFFIFRYGLRVWLTEFACSNTRDPDVALQYMKDILPLLEAADSVWKYSWFVSRFRTGNTNTTDLGWYLDKANSLLEVSSEVPILTPLGLYYNSFQPNS